MLLHEQVYLIWVLTKRQWPHFCRMVDLQGCTSLTDVGLAAIGHMTSLTNVNLQDCRQITGARLLSAINLL